ncbi:hypothetical protein [Antribacter gilvus]|uniref:hypothetical protein n=1 Tax=Antribacter gilvus TaxID=2304675 RepID=UPI000F7966CC|nr:hypothetical protein [Antribacter gilvus]
MSTYATQPVRQIEPTDPIAVAAAPYSYADTFELRLPGPDLHAPEAWVRAGLGATPPWVTRLLGFLGMGKGRQGDPGAVGPFRIVASGPEVIHLEAALPLMRVTMVGRNPEPARRTLTTMLHYHRPVLCRIVWAAVGPTHRRTVAGLLASEVA